MSTDDFDLDGRQLCPDGACIGVIGPDGHCSVCRRAGDPSLPRALATDEPPEEEAVLEVASEGEDAFEDDDRKLCPDGACIGVIGPDGRCKECGREAGS